jgi:acetyl esterase/lipase
MKTSWSHGSTSILLIPMSLIASTFFLCSSSGCREKVPLTTETTLRENNIVFGKGGEVELKLDLCRPAEGEGPFPALVWVFGGGWGFYSGTRAQCPIQTAAEKGFVAITVDYRLTSMVDEKGKPKYPFPAQIQDVKCAIRWLRANAKNYAVDPDRIGVVGWSSGGHLALMAGLTEPSDGLEGEGGNREYSSKVKAVVCTGGLVEAASFHRNTNVPLRVERLLGGPPDKASKSYKIASPITYVRKNNPPVLYIQGDVDRSCPLEQSQLLETKMKQVGASCTLIIKHGHGHEDFFTDPALWRFLDERVKGHR